MGVDNVVLGFGCNIFDVDVDVDVKLEDIPDATLSDSIHAIHNSTRHTHTQTPQVTLADNRTQPPIQSEYL